MQTIDARGLSCPEPVVMTRNAMSSKDPEDQVLVDTVAARENVTRYAVSQGYIVDAAENDGDFTLDIRK